MNDKTEEIEPKKKRHWALAAWLCFVIIMVVFNIGASIFAKDFIKQANPDLPDWFFILQLFFGVSQLTCLIAITKWKKWGFWAQIPFAILVFVENVWIVHSSVTASLFGLLGPIILFAFLKVGGEKQGWKQLT